MKLPSVQITYTDVPTVPGQQLAHRKLLEKDSLPCDIEIPGHGTLFSLRQADNKVLLCPDEKHPLLLNGKAISAATQLVPGDNMEVDGIRLDFHFKHEARSISFASKALAWSARIAVALFILLEITTMCGLSPLLSASSLFEHSIDKQKLSFEIIKLQRMVEEIKAEGPLENAMLTMLKDDIAKRISYMGEYGNVLSSRQRKNMAADLNKINNLLETIAQPGELLKIDEISLENSVKKIINNTK